MNKNDAGYRRIEHQLDYLEKNKDRLVIDADTHVSDLEAVDPEIKEKVKSSANYYHGKPISAEDLIKEMDMAGVNMALTWQNPAATVYTGEIEKDFEALLSANRYIYESAVQYPERIIPAGWTDPKALGVNEAKRMVDICVHEFGFAIVKMNPAQNEFPIDSDPVMELVDKIVEAGAVPAFHFGSDTVYTPVEGLEQIARHIFPKPVIAVHMGGGGAGYVESEELYDKARQLGLRQSNIRYVLSAKRDTHIESDLITYTLAGEPYCRNIFCGSDAPYGRMTWNWGGYRSMFASLVNGARHTDIRLNKKPDTFSEELAGKYMGGNFAEFMIEIYTSLRKTC